MMPIPYSDTKLSADQAFKQKAALQQMQDLLERIAVGKKHRTLTKADRRTLSQEGYAQDLVDNLVLVTQRIPSSGLEGKRFQDQVQIGFTYAAFDPSLYANLNITQHLRDTHQGCCAFCESFLEPSGGGSVFSFRPQSVIFDQQTTLRSLYWQQAYAPTNLYLVCPACGEQHKSAYFPVQGLRSANPNDEQALLLAPYWEQPREFLRFNPLNGNAYAFDRVQAFYQATQNLTTEAVTRLVWKNPRAIPLQVDAQGKALSTPDLDQSFRVWLSSQGDSYPRGQANIDCFGLNRKALSASRLVQAQTLSTQLSTQLNAQSATSDITHIDPQTLAKVVTTLLSQQLQYHSLNLDVVQTCLAQLLPESNEAVASSGTVQEDQPASKPNIQSSNQPNSNAQISSTNLPVQTWPKPGFPTWLMSSVMYMMFENELHIAGKRRLVNLCADDSTYGADNPEKSLFIAVDWWNDGAKVIKVKSKNHIWETSFQELASSRPLEVRNLFANNHLWVEGDFPPLV
ncbi:hypothetical protein RF679_01335 [Undibacterium cyanobacteriorum]|uniref:Uncharacterized protein n=1 Tax=Undibacterium cyanobacteriorum TaxID=3073561 RepID=A0ABY9RI98_9BURK|nr:hypothetical protein [Undibacterium sp. 20NA77.5]WMW80939.1 hypothetical protein RF679_01335 [Undibacterium sp. 20NA77.5]